MYFNEGGRCCRDLGFLKGVYCFILHGVIPLHFQRLADKHNQVRTQMWISQVFKWWRPCVLSCQTALSWEHVYCQALTKWTAPVINQPIKPPQGEHLHKHKPIWCTDGSTGFWKCSEAEARLAIVLVCFPVQLTCTEGRSPRIWLPTPPSVLTDTHGELWGHIWF